MKPKGFTLIELLVAVTIIGLLATVVTVSVAKALERNRDLKRQALIYETADALEKYYADNRQYPKSTDMTIITSWCSAVSGAIQWRRDYVNPSQGDFQSGCVDPIIPSLVPKYIAALPKDPKFSPATEVRGFMYSSDGLNYKLVSYNNVESVNSLSPSDPLYDSNIINWDPLVSKSYSIYSPGGNNLFWGIRWSLQGP